MVVSNQVMLFKDFKTVFQAHFTNIIQGEERLYETDVNKDLLWTTYLESFPVEVRQEFNCNCCKQFIRNYGNLVALKEDKVVSIWDFTVDDPIYQTVVTNLSNLIKRNNKISEVFLTTFAKLGTDSNFDMAKNVRWHHFYYELPKALVYKGRETIESVKNEFRTGKQTFKRALDELTIEATETVLELIAQDSIYRGQEFKNVLEAFLVLQKEYSLLSEEKKDNYCWVKSVKAGSSLSRIRNSAIGTLLIDISAGLDLDQAVRKFESVMAPTNYKRPKAIFTKKMVEEAENSIKELGLENSLGRRFAAPEDISVNNVLFVNRDVKTAGGGGIFDEMKEEATVVNPKQFSKVEEIKLEDFINKVLPKANSIEVLLENRHQGNLVSLIAPQDMDAPSLFKWDNGFSWSYNNAVADSLTKELVKAFGGDITGVLRFSIRWNDSGNNNIDFDAWVTEPNGNRIGYSTFRGKGNAAPSTGNLDVDIVSPSGKVAVENITWSNLSRMREGKYVFQVNNFCGSTSKEGFKAEIEYDGEIYSFEYAKPLRGKEWITVAEADFSKTNRIQFTKSLDSSSVVSSKEIWGLNTNKFQKVNMILFSPNHWDNQGIGNKHVFFMLEGANNTGDVRGFFNEFLKEDLLKQKRVFEAMAGKMKVAPSHKQLSGLGFSTTNKADFIVKVSGRVTRMLKVVV